MASRAEGFVLHLLRRQDTGARAQPERAEWASALVGRRPEVAAFERALAEVGRDDARVVALLGVPGIGKSRPLVELSPNPPDER